MINAWILPCVDEGFVLLVDGVNFGHFLNVCLRMRWSDSHHLHQLSSPLRQSHPIFVAPQPRPYSFITVPQDTPLLRIWQEKRNVGPGNIC